MDIVGLGRTGMKVSRLCLGTANFGSWGRTSRQDCDDMVRTALDAGINFIDTADAYAAGESETLVGHAIKAHRDDIVLSTKFRYPCASDGPNDQGGSRRWIIRAVEGSLRRLGTDWIDLYQMHAPDPDTEIEETLAALTDLVAAGKIRSFGSSAFHAEDMAASHHIARERRTGRFVSEQLPYSIFVREVEKHVLPTCEQYGMAALTWGVVNSGWLSGRYRRGQGTPGDSRALNWPVTAARFDFDRPEADRKLDLVEELASLADKAGLSLTDLALGFVFEHPAVTAIMIGPRTVEQLTQLAGAGATRLGTDVLDEIDRIVPPGTNVDQVDLHNYRYPALEPARRRRHR
jgi:aryl-alcohol dehydrogenase-like predicted oxidoreductase